LGYKWERCPKTEPTHIRILRPLLGLTVLDWQRNVDIRNTLQIYSILEDTKLQQKNWRDLLKGMKKHRLQILGFQNEP
jgi:hypothetical protein